MNKTTFLFALLLPLLIYSQDSFINTYDYIFISSETTPIKTYTVLDAGINTIYNDEGGTFFKDKFIISSNRKIGAFVKKDALTNEPYSKLYCMDIKQSGELKRPLLFSSSLNAKDAHIGSVAFTPDEKTVYFTKSNHKNNYQLYKASLDKKGLGKWENIELVAISLNQPYLDIKDLYINPEGNLLYFSSNSKKEGFGGYDIYASEILENKDLSSPLNLGYEINSSGDERSPYISADKKHLYFASTGHNSYGGLDIYKSRIVHHQFMHPINLGQEINSRNDDYAYIKANNKMAYFTSNREGGKGKTDIYKVIINEGIQDMSGYVLEDLTKIVLPNAILELRNQENELISTTKSDQYGYYNFKNITPLERYRISIHKDGYFNLNSSFNAYKTKNYTYKENFILHTETPELIKVEDKLLINLEKIYFNYDSWILTKESEVSLNKVAILLKKNPNYLLKIVAHTDNRGDAAYNLLLSQKRAKATLNYLVNEGVNKKRLEAFGKGETKLLIDCGENCSENEHLANRRLEFIITNK